MLIVALIGILFYAMAHVPQVRIDAKVNAKGELVEEVIVERQPPANSWVFKLSDRRE